MQRRSFLRFLASTPVGLAATAVGASPEPKFNSAALFKNEAETISITVATESRRSLVAIRDEMQRIVQQAMGRP